MSVPNIIRPGRFGQEVLTDTRRIEFDFKNESLIANECRVDTVFFGDSITHFWEIGAYFEGKEGLLINRGIGGDNTVFGLRRLEADVLQLHPKRCVMMLGVNDAWDMETDNWWQLPVMTLEETLQRAKRNLHEIIDRILAQGIELVVCSLTPTDMKFTTREELRHDYILMINEDLETYCANKPITFVDYYSAMADEDGRRVRKGLTFEGIHPNSDGYRIMADLLTAAVPELKKG